MTLPYQEPLVRREPGPRTIPEPPRPGDPGGPPCRLCPVRDGELTIWSDEHWVLNHGVQTSLPGTVWLTTRIHVDSFADLPPDWEEVLPQASEAAVAEAKSRLSKALAA